MTTSNRNYLDIITGIYQVHNPSKIKEVPDLLKKYKGQEEALLQSIIRKYGVKEAELAKGEINTANVGLSKKKSKNKVIWVTIGLITIAIFVFWWLNETRRNEEAVETVVSNEEQTIQEGYTRNTEITPSDRKQVLDLLRKPIEADLGSKVKFYVVDIKRCDGWVRLKVKPLSPEGEALNNGEAIEALFIKNNSPWQLEDYQSADEANLLSWSKQYGINGCIDFLQ